MRRREFIAGSAVPHYGRWQRTRSPSSLLSGFQAASNRLISVSNSNRSCAPSSSGSQFVICGKMVR
jgi:hypothetical protein